MSTCASLPTAWATCIARKRSGGSVPSKSAKRTGRSTLPCPMAHRDPMGTRSTRCGKTGAITPRAAQEIVVRDLAWLSPDAYRSLWMFFKRHDLVGRVRWNNAPSDDPAIEYFLEPRMLDARDGEGFWLRLVDVAAALRGRGWTTDGDVSITVRDDSLAPWNTGNYRLTVSGRGGRRDVLRGRHRHPAIRQGIGIALCRAAFGARNCSHGVCWTVARMRSSGLIPCSRRGTAPHCPDHF